MLRAIFYKNGKNVYMRDSINNLSFFSFHFLTYDSERKKLTSEKKLSSDCKPLKTSN